MDDPWISMDYPWIIDVYPWIIYGYPEAFSSPNGKPFNLRGSQPDQSRWSVCAHLCKFQDVQVSTFHVSVLYKFQFYFGRHRGPPRIRLGGSWGHQGSFWRYSVYSMTVPGIQKRLKTTVECFTYRFRRNSRRSMRNRCPVIFQIAIPHLFNSLLKQNDPGEEP